METQPLSRQLPPQPIALKSLKRCFHSAELLLSKQQPGGLSRLLAKATHRIQQAAAAQAHHWGPRGHGLHRSDPEILQTGIDVGAAAGQQARGQQASRNDASSTKGTVDCKERWRLAQAQTKVAPLNTLFVTGSGVLPVPIGNGENNGKGGGLSGLFLNGGDGADHQYAKASGGSQVELVGLSEQDLDGAAATLVMEVTDASGRTAYAEVNVTLVTGN